jgi:hypothetical protein
MALVVLLLVAVATVVVEGSTDSSSLSRLPSHFRTASSSRESIRSSFDEEGGFPAGPSYHRGHHRHNRPATTKPLFSTSTWRQPTTEVVGSSCALALVALCARGDRSSEGVMLCDVCAGKHSHNLQAAGCTSTEVQAWCAGATGGEPIDARKDFGCKGDGVADDTACLQAALDAGGIQRRKIYIPGGTYLVSSSLLVKGSNSSMYNESYNHEPITGDGKMSTFIQAMKNSNWGPTSDNLAVILFPSCCGALPQSGSAFQLSDLTVDANNVAGE